MRTCCRFDFLVIFFISMLPVWLTLLEWIQIRNTHPTAIERFLTKEKKFLIFNFQFFDFWLIWKLRAREQGPKKLSENKKTMEEEPKDKLDVGMEFKPCDLML